MGSSSRAGSVAGLSGQARGQPHSRTSRPRPARTRARDPYLPQAAWLTAGGPSAALLPPLPSAEGSAPPPAPAATESPGIGGRGGAAPAAQQPSTEPASGWEPPSPRNAGSVGLRDGVEPGCSHQIQPGPFCSASGS